MDFLAWSKTYWDEAARVRQKIEAVRREPLPRSKDEQLLQQRRLTLLQGMYQDCRYVARILERKVGKEKPWQKTI